MGNSRRQIYLATGNVQKVLEFQRLAEMSKLEVDFVSAPQMPFVKEDTGTFVGNARKKAAALKAILPTDAWVLADDSGLCVDALGGAPGVESAYYAGATGDSMANLAKLVKVMSDVPPGNRGAHFVCILVLMRSNGHEHICEGHCDGVLAHEPAGGAGFGYDSLFIPNGITQTYAQLSDKDKNKISHRGRAWLILGEWLANRD